MVIHDDYEMPEEVPITMEPKRNTQNSNSCVNLENFLREHDSTDNNLFSMNNLQDKTLEVSSNVIKDQGKKSQKKSKKNITSCSNSEDSNVDMQCITNISAEDLEELRTAYKQCKTVIKKIETKYGHLLDLAMEGPSNKRSKLGADELQNETECQCTLNKKIVFDDEGKEVTIDPNHDNHICPTKLMLNKSQNIVMRSDDENIQIEYHSNEIELSDSLPELRDILQNINIETAYRNQVINKLRLLKQEHINEIRFNKHLLVEKLKSNSEELLDFKGSNLSVLSGYLY